MDVGKFDELGGPQNAVGFRVYGSEGEIGRVIATHRDDWLFVDTGLVTRAFETDSVERVDSQGASVHVSINRAEIGDFPVVVLSAQREVDEDEIRRLEEELRRGH